MAATGKGTSFLESFSPWASRSTTPKPAEDSDQDAHPKQLSNQGIADHTISRLHKLTPKDYPRDCPRLNVRWFYATDSPKRKPLPLNSGKDAKPLPAPKKYSAFSARDSRSIEIAFQRLTEEQHTKPGSSDGSAQVQQPQGADLSEPKSLGGDEPGFRNASQNVKSQGEAGIKESPSHEEGGKLRVPVNEDFLFDVDIEARELAPIYWLGPIYDVRRGSWFYQEGSALRPCEENLADQLEEGYLRVKPWRNESSNTTSTPPKSRPVSMNVEEVSKANEKNKENSAIPAKLELQSQRLFGAYMNQVVTFQDTAVAWLLTDDLLSRLSSTVYQRFAAGGHLAGVKVVRGYAEAAKDKAKEAKKESDQNAESKTSSAAASTDKPKRRCQVPQANKQESEAETKEEIPTTEQEPRLLALERQLSSMSDDPARKEEEMRQANENEIKEDYKDEDGQEQNRDIEHLILVTHGIGQRLGLRMESINFIHDVNVLRKTLKTVYQDSPDLQVLNSEVDKLPKNCRIQVLPVVWRHLLDFPKQSFKQSNKEQDLTDVDTLGDDEEYPSLDNITVEGVAPIRNLITDLALDILLYQSAYREHIAAIVQRECNRVYDLFMQRNPSFSGKVSFIGHSLGSAILFDILCRQKDAAPSPSSLNRQKLPNQRNKKSVAHQQKPDLGLKFDVEDFFCLGSPLGLYQMLKGSKIVARDSVKGLPKQSSLNSDTLDDPFLGAGSTQSQTNTNSKDSEILTVTLSSPKCQQLYNIFHPADPIAYRIEPLVSRAMSSLKPQPLPYTKKGIFGAQGQGFTNIGARVGQSVSGLWSNITSGMANSLLNRSLGLTGEGQLASSHPIGAPQIQNKPPSSTNANSGTSAGATFSSQEHNANLENEEHPPTLIDSEIETLYAGFEKRRKSHQSDKTRDLGESEAWMEAEDREKRLKREEAKVRALNTNGRVDFSIQEGLLDITLWASIASHLSYWADEDVAHFMISQLLSRQRIIKR